jgi:hypothetical protein
LAAWAKTCCDFISLPKAGTRELTLSLARSGVCHDGSGVGARKLIEGAANARGEPKVSDFQA